MTGLLSAHIAALLLWAAALLYLPALIAASSRQRAALTEPPDPHDSVARFFFTHMATPSALVAIIAGTAVFLVDRNTQPWLILKLSLVSLLAVCHVLLGLLVLRSEDPKGRPIARWCALLGITVLLLLLAITWVVLAKPVITVEVAW